MGGGGAASGQKLRDGWEGGGTRGVQSPLFCMREREREREIRERQRERLERERESIERESLERDRD